MQYDRAIGKIYEDQYQEYLKAKLKKCAVEIVNLDSDIQKDFIKLQLCVKSFELIEKLLDPKTFPVEEKKKLQTMLIAYIMKKQASNLLTLCVIKQAQQTGINLKEAMKDKPVAALTAQDRERIIKMMPKKIQDIYVPMQKAITERE